MLECWQGRTVENVGMTGEYTEFEFEFVCVCVRACEGECVYLWALMVECAGK